MPIGKESPVMAIHFHCFQMSNVLCMSVKYVRSRRKHSYIMTHCNQYTFYHWVGSSLLRERN